MKTNLSKIFRYVLITFLNILCIFVIQYYINTTKSISKSLSDLQIAIFISNFTENSEDDIISKINNYNKLVVIELISSKNTDKFLEINPELADIIPKETIDFPSFVLANNVCVGNIVELEQLKEELLQNDFVEDIVYDQNAYSMFFSYQELMNKYKKIFSLIFYILVFLFLLKLLFFLIKNLYKDIFFEILFGIILGFCSYSIICLVTIFYQSNIFILNWQVLYFLVPLSSMISLLTKESNV